MSRSKRALIGQETTAIVERGSYRAANGAHVDISRWVAECLDGTKAIMPPNSDLSWADFPSGRRDTVSAITNETTLSASRRLVVDRKYGKTLCLNFASAKNPGGGFLGGSQAQEESLARMALSRI